MLDADLAVHVLRDILGDHSVKILKLLLCGAPFFLKLHVQGGYHGAEQKVECKSSGGSAPSADEGEGCDELLGAAVEVILETGQASVSMLQRRLKLGYSRAARLVDQMEERGYVGPFEGSKPRQLLITREKWQELQMAKGASPAEADKPADRYGSIHDVFESHDALE